MKSSKARSGVFLLAAFVCGLGACIPNTDERIQRLRLSGGCAEGREGPWGELAFLNISEGQRLSFLPDRPGVILPRQGAFTHPEGSIEDGEFTLFGPYCTGAGTCPSDAPFAYCSVRRLSWQLEVVCVDGMQQPHCTGRLDEVGTLESWYAR